MAETTAVAHGGNPLWRHCLPKTALHRYQQSRSTFLPIAYCLLPIAFCLLPFASCLLPLASCLSQARLCSQLK
ncbi:MAG: hypothetical protein F6J90_31670 [Moorea sp. SIOASIH]|nr:hypothetical protein [Moorena sp. SIOASIH]